MKTKFLLITVVISFFLCNCGSSGDFLAADSTDVTASNEELSLAAELASREAAEQVSIEAEEQASREAEKLASREAAEQATETVVDVTESSTEAATRSYVLNTSTKKIHYPSCKDVDKIKSKNRKDVEANLDDLTNQGYSPCGHCKPR